MNSFVAPSLRESPAHSLNPTPLTECPFCAAECGCDAADFFEILAEQEVYSDE